MSMEDKVASIVTVFEKFVDQRESWVVLSVESYDALVDEKRELEDKVKYLESELQLFRDSVQKLKSHNANLEDRVRKGSNIHGELLNRLTKKRSELEALDDTNRALRSALEAERLNNREIGEAWQALSKSDPLEGTGLQAYETFRNLMNAEFETG